MADATMYLCPTGFDEAPKEHVIHAASANRLLLGIEGDHGGTGQPLKDLPVTSGEIGRA